MSRQLTAANLPLRGARSIRGGLFALAVVVLVLCAALAAWPRAITGVLTADLQYRMSTASAPTRDLQSSIDSGLGFAPSFGDLPPIPVDTVWKSMTKSLTHIRAQMPASVRAITGPGRYVGRDGGAGGRGVPASGPPHPPAGASYLLALEADPQLKSDAVLVDGRWPHTATNFFNGGPLEVVVSANAAKLLHWKIGQKQTLTGSGREPEEITLVGTLRPRDETTDYWQLDRTRAQAGAQPSTDGDHTTYTGVAWMNASSWEDVSGVFPGPSVVSWYPVNGAGLSVDTISPTVASLQRFLSVPRLLYPTGSQVQARFSTNLPSVADDFLSRASPAAAVLSVVGTGPLGTGCAVVILGVILLIDRRRFALSLIRARGASERRLRGTVAWETAFASIPAAIAGGALAGWLTPGAIGPLLVGTVAACAILPVGAAAVRVGRARVTLGRRTGSGANPARWVTEVVVLLVTALSIVLLLQRGLTPDSVGVGVDPLLTLAPILVVVVVALAILRGYPFVLRWVGSLLRRRPGVVGYVGWATVARKPSRFLSIFAVVAGLSIAIFSLTILETERDGIRNAQLEQVGADVSVSAQPLPADAPGRLAELAGVARVVPIDSAGGISLTGVSDSVALFTVDAKDLASVQSGLPASLRRFSQLGVASGGRTTVIAGGFQQKPPPTTSIDGAGGISVRVDELPGLSPSFLSDPPWVLMDRAALPSDESFTEQPLAVLLQIRAGDDTAATLASIRRIVGPSATIVDTARLVNASKTAPVVSGFELLTAAALGFSALMCGLALVLTLLLGTEARIRLLARLRALGFARSQSGGLVAWELGPLVVLGAVAGLVVGLVLPSLLLRAIDLSGFTGSVTNPAIVLDPLAILAVVGGFAVAAIVATLVAIADARRARNASVLRNSGED